MRILIISYSYAPVISPRAFRWTALAEHWAKQGCHIDVVSAWKPGLSRQEVVNGVYIHRVGGGITEVVRNKLRKSATHLNIEFNQPTKLNGFRTTRSLTSLAQWVHDQTWKKVYWPDYSCLWYLPGLKKAKQLLELGSDYDTLISVSHPFTGHLVGYNLKKYHPRMQWLVDIGDPFCFLEHMPTNNHSLYKKLNYAFEEKVFIQANAVTVTTELTLKIYADIFPETAEKIRVIPPLLSLDTNYNCQNLVFSTKTNNLRLVFVGTLHQLMRKPDFLLKIFEKLLTTHLAEKLELHFVGSLNNCEDFFKEYNKLFNEKIFFHGKVSHYQALQAMKEADVLVNIGNEFPYQLPSKVVEYVSLGKPILNIAKVAEDSSAAFFKSYPASLCLFEEKEGVDSDQFSKLIQFLDQLPSVDCNQLEHWLETYCITAISEGYKSLIH